MSGPGTDLARPRVAVTSAAPELYQKLIDLHVTAERQAVEAGLAAGLVALVRVRASQLNGCAFCVDLHTSEAAGHGEDTRRLHALPVWRESGLFTARERAALALTEAITLLAETRVPDAVYATAAAEFSEPELAQLVWAVTVINAFNRLAVTSRIGPRPR
ncbi:carboxymuconolactone decarboxylase family protein [Actinokineospora iranica]|uniref:Alkylhydroperoxidase AhpD family core domain-containing protein n=1 Tax=Actinokineospora iranica TaxID=1271860 RepID=A0A1G6MCQ1_9PSEU|nr:carboxymuconolactone decarboxylase family protein [Actinokineospora iranica]SDC53240.1 alkylhydroperoxidase AhpD family core domain-containing protein [Actinokineospora iranica]